MLAVAIKNAMAKRANLGDSEQSSPSPIKHAEKELNQTKDDHLIELLTKSPTYFSQSSQQSPTKSPGLNNSLSDTESVRQSPEVSKGAHRRRSSVRFRDPKQSSNSLDQSAQNINGEAGDTQSGTLGMSPGHHREKPSGFTAMQNIRRKISLSHLFLNKAKSSVWDPSMGPKLTWVLKKEVKSMKDAEYIYESIKNFPFFSRFMDQTLEETEEVAVLQMCRAMRYESVNAGQYIFKEGDPSNDKFYIILSGVVSVVLKSDSNVFMEENIEDENKEFGNMQSEVISKKKNQRTTQNIKKISLFARTVAKFSVISRKKNKDDEKEKIQQEEQNRHQASKFKEAAQKALEEDENSQPEQRGRSPEKRKTLKRTPDRRATTELGVINKQIKAGESFGERALTNKDAKRNASILTNTDCELIILMKQDYMSIMERYNKESRNKLEFLKKNLPYVNKISSASVLQDYLYIFHDAYYHRGNTIMNEDEKGDRVFILVSGQIKLEKKIYYDNPFETSKIHKTVFMANATAPTMFGEELLFDPHYQKKYKYTVKADSQEVKVYYCNADALRIRFPKETQTALREYYLIKDKFRTQRYEFLKKADRENNALLKTQTSTAEAVVDYRYRDIIDFVSKPCRGTLINKFRATPDEVLEYEHQNSPEEIEEKKKCLEKFTRNVESIRMQALHEYHLAAYLSISNYLFLYFRRVQKTLESMDCTEFQARPSTSLAPKLQADSSPIPQRTLYGGMKASKLQLQSVENSPKNRGSLEKNHGSLEKNRGSLEKILSRASLPKGDSDDENVESPEAEVKHKEKGSGEKTPTVRTVSEIHSPVKSAIKQPPRRNVVFSETLSNSPVRPTETPNFMSGQTTAPTDREEKVVIPSKRQYIIRGSKRTQSQEEIEQNMQNFEKKLMKITQENLANGGRFQLNDNETMGYTSQRLSASLGLVSKTHSQPNSPKSRNSPSTLSPSSPFKTATRKFFSLNPSPRDQSLEPLETEIERKVASDHITQRLISSLNIQKNSGLMKTLNGFSQTMTGFKKPTPNIIPNRLTLKPEDFFSPKSERVETPLLDFNSTKVDTNSPKHDMVIPTADSIMPKIDSKRQVFMKLSSDREFEVPHHLKFEIMQSPNSSLLNIISISNSKNIGTESESPPHKFKTTWHGSLTPTMALKTKQHERTALNSQKKVKEMNKRSAVQPLNLAAEKLQGQRMSTSPHIQN